MKDRLPSFKLTASEINSALWGRLMEHFENRLNRLRTDNDRDADESATSNLRGRIAEIKSLMHLDTDYE